MHYRIYLDVCCLNRPFDDQTQLRIHLETEAVISILQQCETKQWHLITSTPLEAEIAQIPDPEQLQQVRIALSLASIKVSDSPALRARTSALVKLGFSFYDAAHIANAEKAKADIFLSTDDRLVKRAKQLVSIISIKVDSPLHWLTAITDQES